MRGLMNHIRYWFCFWRGHLVYDVAGHVYRCCTCDRTW